MKKRSDSIGLEAKQQEDKKKRENAESIRISERLYRHIILHRRSKKKSKTIIDKIDKAI